MNVTQRNAQFLAALDSLRPNRTVIGSFEDVFKAMFGPQQHDAHVTRRRHYVNAQNFKRAADAADRRVEEWIKETRGRP